MMLDASIHFIHRYFTIYEKFLEQINLFLAIVLQLYILAEILLDENKNIFILCSMSVADVVKYCWIIICKITFKPLPNKGVKACPKSI